MATTSGNLPTGETITGKRGPRPDLALKVAVGVALLGFAAVLAFAVLRMSATAPAQPQAAPAPAITQANPVDHRFLEWNTIILPGAGSDAPAAPFVPDQFTYREDHRTHPGPAPTEREYVPDFWTYREDRRDR